MKTGECSLNEKKKPSSWVSAAGACEAGGGGYEIIVYIEHRIMWL